MHVLIDTGCRFNLMSSSTVERLGSVGHVSVCSYGPVRQGLFPSQSLQERVEESEAEAEVLPFQRRLSVDAHIPELGLTLGQHRILCSFLIVGEGQRSKGTWFQQES